MHGLGGSHAKRDLFVLMLIDSALKTGGRALARSIAVERAVLHPPGRPPGNWRWAGRSSRARRVDDPSTKEE